MTPAVKVFVSFCLIGVVGFIIDGGLLYLLVLNQFDPYFVRALSFPLAVTATWYLNRHWAFGIRPDTPGKGRDYRRYILVQIGGATANYLVYALILIFIAHIPSNVLAAFAIGSLLGLAINFCGSRWWVFRDSLHSGQTGTYERH
jgi:putative flippase GtrA